jgi:hypothetical protein
MHGLLKQPGYRLYPPRSPETEALARRAGPRFRRPQPRPRLPRTNRGHDGPGHRRDQPGRGVRGQSRGLVPGPARGLQRALHSAALVKVHELLGRAPRAAQRGSSSTARCRAKPRAALPSTGWPAEATIRSTHRHRRYAAAASRPSGDPLRAPGPGHKGSRCTAKPSVRTKIVG